MNEIKKLHRPPQSARLLFAFSAFMFLTSAFVGLLASTHYGVSGEHAQWTAHLRMEQLRPLHILLASVAMLAGAMAIHQSMHASIAQNSNREKGEDAWRGNWNTLAAASLILFSVVSASMILMGKGSGREYAPWPPLLTLPLIFATAICTLQLIRRLPETFRFSPEGAVLLSIGWLLTFFGFVETQSFLLPWVHQNGVKDLTSQWHGIDTFVAGINVLLYAGMILLLQPYPKPLRKRLLFAIAGFGLLGTFGHHHYVSPQPLFLKYFAFLASMVAVLSFIRHVQGYRKQQKVIPGSDEPLLKLLLTAEAWTLVAVGTGVLFAIPQINFYIHGTYLVISHAMGSMIGINFIIIVAAGLCYCGYSKQGSSHSIRWGLPILNISLIVFWLGLAIPSIIKGFARIDSSYQAFHPVLEPWLVLFPIAGIGLFTGIFVLASEVIWATASSRSVSVNTPSRDDTEISNLPSA